MSRDLFDGARLEIEASLSNMHNRLNGQLYGGPWSLDPEAFPAPLSLVPRRRRALPDQWACGEARFDTEAEARAFAGKYNARVSRVKRWSVPKGTKYVRAALVALERALAWLPAWDEMEMRRRYAFDAWRKGNRVTVIADPNVPADRIYGIAARGLAAWLPQIERIDGEKIIIPVTYGGPR